MGEEGLGRGDVGRDLRFPRSEVEKKRKKRSEFLRLFSFPPPLVEEKPRQPRENETERKKNQQNQNSPRSCFPTRATPIAPGSPRPGSPRAEAGDVE